MAAGAAGAIVGLQDHVFVLFFASFLGLFVASGVGNGSTYRMIPAVFQAGVDRKGADLPGRRAAARKAAAGCLGIAGAVGAFGGFLIPRGFAASTATSGGIVPALGVFIVVYMVMAVTTWWNYQRSTAGVLAAAVI
jgi:NNP family nitrate/nitrite transporter-like MFS transporter